MSVSEHVAEQVTDVCTEHGEGVVWDAAAGVVRFVDLEAGGLMTYDPASGVVSRRQVGKIAACVRPRRSGGLVVAAERTFVLLGPDGSTDGELGPIFEDERIRFNDGGCDPAGRFWMGTMAYDETEGAGCVYRLDADGDVAPVLTGVTISTGRVDRLEVDPATATIRRRSPIVEHVEPGHPDGIAVDTEGGVWVALWDGSGVNRYDAQGRLTDVVRLPCSQVTCPAFAGPDLRDLYVTTSRRDLPEGEQPAAGALFPR